VDISGLANGATLVLAYGMSVTRNADGSVTFSGVEQGDSYGIGTGANTFNAVDTQDVTGKFDLGIFALTTTNLGHPLDLALGVTATDHDGDPSTGTIHLTLVPSGSSSAAAVNTLMATNSLSTQSTDTSHLVSSNDNDHHFHLQRAFGNGGNATVIGALAAAGLTASHLEEGRHHVSARGEGHGPEMTPLHTAAVTSVAPQAGGEVQTSHLIQPVGHDSGHTMLHGARGHDVAEHARVSIGEKGHAVSELAHGTDAVHAGYGHGAAAQLTAAAIAMPSVQQLVAAKLAPQGHEGVAGSHHVVAGHDVGKVLADALHGGHEHGTNIDALINSLPGHAGRGDPLEALASHGHGAVSNGHSGVFASFTSGHGAPIMEHMMMHQDAVQAHS
jgi:hypothetical protein